MRSSTVPGLLKQQVPAVWSSIPVIVVGLVFATVAILAGPWPSDPALPVSGYTISHIERAQGKPASPVAAKPEKTIEWYGRRGLDAAVYVVLLAGYASVIVTVWYGVRMALVGSAVSGLAGMVYGASLGFYAGPIMTMNGFALVFFGACLGWVAWNPANLPTQGPALDDGATKQDTKSHDLSSAARS